MKLRDRLRWRIARLLDRLPGQCWADLAVWALGWRRSPWAPITQSCRSSLTECGACYCGKLRRPEGGER